MINKKIQESVNVYWRQEQCSIQRLIWHTFKRLCYLGHSQNEGYVGTRIHLRTHFSLIN